MTTERIDEPTPKGGDYSEIFYLNNSGEIIDKERATCAVIRECKANGTLIAETFMTIEPE
jgi:hypothetical protein